MNTARGPENASALYGRIPTKRAISNCRKQNPINPNAPCNAIKVQRPPILNHYVKLPCASGPHNNNKERPILFAGEDTAAVKKLHPSKNELANP